MKTFGFEQILLCVSRAQQLFDDVLEKLDEEFWSVRQLICRSYAEFCHYHTFQKDLAIAYYKKVRPSLCLLSPFSLEAHTRVRSISALMTRPTEHKASLQNPLIQFCSCVVSNRLWSSAWTHLRRGTVWRSAGFCFSISFYSSLPEKWSKV